MTPISRLNIVVERVCVVHEGHSYNAFVSDKVSGKRLFDESEKHETVTKALERLLEYTCLMLETHREDPEEWRRHSALIIQQLGHHSPSQTTTDIDQGRRTSELPSGNTTDSEVEANVVSPTPARSQKRNASAMESVADGEYFAGFTRLPGAPIRRDTYKDNDHDPSVPPAGDASFAAARCALLPPTVSDGARKMLFELLTRPQDLFPRRGIHIFDILDDTGLEYLEARDYVYELASAGKARETDHFKWIPIDLSEDSIFAAHLSGRRNASTESELLESQAGSFSGFAVRFPPSTPPYSTSIGDARSATIACTSLPPNISIGAQKLLYELITRPMRTEYFGVSLVDISDDTGLHYSLLFQFAKELEKIERAKPEFGPIWFPTGLPPPE